MSKLIGGVCAAAYLVLTLPTQAQSLNDSGQVTCYGASASNGVVSSSTPDPEPPGFNEQDCSIGLAAADAVGVHFKKGASSLPGRDYSKIANDGSELPASATLGSSPGDWACTRDNITGLIWEIKTSDGGLRDQSHNYTWYDEDDSRNGGDGNEGASGSDTCSGTLPSGLCNTAAYISAVNALGGSGLCGGSDWRLPRLQELISLVHYDSANGNNEVDFEWLPNAARGTVNHWSADSVGFAPSSAWVAVLGGGGLTSFTAKTQARTVILVRTAP